MNTFSVKWIFAWKSEERGRLVKAKGELAASGSSQNEGIGFFDTYAPTHSVAGVCFGSFECV